MTDHDEPTIDGPEFDDPAFDELRGLLADAKVSAPVPADVAARLDATLADLVADRVTDLAADRVTDRAARTDPVDDVVVPLRRRSRLAPRLLAAASVVVLLGAGAVGLGRVLDGSTVANDSSPSAASAADSGREAPPSSLESAPGAAAGGSTTRDPADNALVAFPQLSSAAFASDVEKLVTPVVNLSGATGGLDSGTKPGPTDPTDPSAPTAPDQPRARSAQQDQAKALDRDQSRNTFSAKSCPGPVGEVGRVLRIRLDDELAVLVIGPLDDGSRLVRAWSCDGGTVLASASVDH